MSAAMQHSLTQPHLPLNHAKRPKKAVPPEEAGAGGLGRSLLAKEEAEEATAKRRDEALEQLAKAEAEALRRYEAGHSCRGDRRYGPGGPGQHGPGPRYSRNGGAATDDSK